MNDLIPLIEKAVGFSSDHRTLRKGSIFVALKGEKVDGHDFVAEAIQSKGAIAAIIAKGRLTNYPTSIQSSLFEVEDVAKAHRMIAGLMRKKYRRTKIIAVGGSNGKTSTKDFLFHFMSQKFKCIKTWSSQNGELGIPKTLEGLSADVDWAIVEIGVDGPGEMQRHVDLVVPDFCALVSIGEEHLNLFKNVANVFKEERVLIDQALKVGAKAFLPDDDQWLNGIEDSRSIKRFLMNSKGARDVKSKMPLFYDISKRNAWFAYCIAEALEISQAELDAALSTLTLPRGRGRLIHNKALDIVDDSYNANISSMKIALESLKKFSALEGKSAVAVIGDMFDLGESSGEVHMELATFLHTLELDLIYLVGAEMNKLKSKLGDGRYKYFQSTDELLKSNLTDELKHKSAVCLVKGSRGMALDLFVDELIKI